MAAAIDSTFTSLMGSSLTTVFGFLALCFMSFTLGKDMGLVMAKGVILGVITVVTFLPALILMLDKVIEKTRHKSIAPKFNKLSRLCDKAQKSHGDNLPGALYPRLFPAEQRQEVLQYG